MKAYWGDEQGRNPMGELYRGITAKGVGDSLIKRITEALAVLASAAMLISPNCARDNQAIQQTAKQTSSAQADSLSEQVNQFALYVDGGNGVYNFVNKYTSFPEGFKPLSMDTLVVPDFFNSESDLFSMSPQVQMTKYEVLNMEGIIGYSESPTILSGMKEHAKEIVDNLINPYHAKTDGYVKAPELAKGNLKFKPMDSMTGGYLELRVNEKGKVEDAKIIAVYGTRNITQDYIDTIINRANGLDFKAALDAQGKTVSGTIVLPFQTGNTLDKTLGSSLSNPKTGWDSGQGNLRNENYALNQGYTPKNLARRLI